MHIENLPGFKKIKFTHELDRLQIWEFIERMKAVIPASAREYDPERKTWTIPDLWMPEFDRLYDEMFKDKNQISIDFMENHAGKE